MSVHVSVRFYWRDLWVGLYVPKPARAGPWLRRDFYLCLVPAFPIHVRVIHQGVADPCATNRPTTT